MPGLALRPMLFETQRAAAVARPLLARPGQSSCNSWWRSLQSQRSRNTQIPCAAIGGALNFSTTAQPTDTQLRQPADSRSYPRICILGGGFGGLYTAVRLESLTWPKGIRPEVTLVDQHERFVFKPLLYELLNGTADSTEVAPLFSQLLSGLTTTFVQGSVEGITVGGGASSGGASGVVTLAGGSTIPYDWLVVALGAEVDPRGVPGVGELAAPFVTYDDTMLVKARLEDLEQSVGSQGGLPRVVVVGAGYAGVELACVIAERAAGRLQVQVLTPSAGIMDGSPAGQRATAESALAKLGVEVVTGVRVRSLAPLPGLDPVRGGACLVETEDFPPTTPLDPPSVGAGARTSPADLVLWTAGSAPVTRRVQRSGLPFPTTDRGAVLTEPTLRVQDQPHVFALGDVSVAQGELLPVTAQVAIQQADYAAWNVWAAINNRTLLPFRYQHLGSMMALGTLNGAVAVPLQLPAALTSAIRATPLSGVLDLAGIQLGDEDSVGLGGAGAAGGVTVQGPLAALLRRAAYLYRQPTNEQRVSVALSWVQQAAELAAKATSAPRS